MAVVDNYRRECYRGIGFRASQKGNTDHFRLRVCRILLARNNGKSHILREWTACIHSAPGSEGVEIATSVISHTYRHMSVEHEV